MGSEGGGAAERSAERRETTAHLGSAREPERAAASSSLFPSLPPFLQLGACLAHIAALSLAAAGAQLLSFYQLLPLTPVTQIRAAASPHTPARKRAGGPGPASHRPSLPSAPPPAASLRGRGAAPGRPPQRAPPGPVTPAPTSAGGSKAGPAPAPLLGSSPPGWGGAAPRCPSRTAWGYCLPALRQPAVKIIIKSKTNTPIRSFLDTRVGATAAQVLLFPGWK